MKKIVSFLAFLSLLSLMSSGLLWLIAAAYDLSTLAFYATHLIWVSNLLYAFVKIKNRFIFLTLNLTYFLFYIGRITFSYIFDHNFSLNYSDDIVMKVFNILFIGLFSIRIFAVYFEKVKIAKIRESNIFWRNNSNININLLNKIVLTLFWLSFPCSLAVIVERVIFVQSSGYANYYTSFTTSLPEIVIKLDGINVICFFLFLATNPSKKKFKLPALAYILLGILSLGYGQRNPLALSFCMLFLIYIPLREKFRSVNEERWITKKYKVFCTITLPILILVFSFWKYYRLGLESSNSIGNLIMDFFNTEGNSSFIIGETIKSLDFFPKERIYTIGPIVDFFTNNFIYKALFGEGAYYAGFTVDAATKGWNFGKTISYLYNSRQYLAGVGTGSCYLAEVYKDFGYIGIPLITLVYMAIINYVQKSYKKNWVLSAVALLSINKIIYAPRDAALSFVGEFFSFTFIICIIIIIFLYLYINNRKEPNHEFEPPIKQ
ncbi:UNVERIFIED_ORG: oligosaccharide repeat unit polymerase [Heyndrickxia coagulans]